MTGDRASAEDLVHDAIVRSFGKPRVFPNLNAADAYVRRAIANGFIDGARSRKSMWGALPRMVVDEALPDEAIADRMDVRAALKTLPPRQRTCVVMRFYDDMLVADIANALGLSDGAVKRYLSDGIQHLNAKLGTSADPNVVDVPLVDVNFREGRAGR
jgi:RNA polymerase sigma-70 factor (ECF subfamily)